MHRIQIWAAVVLVLGCASTATGTLLKAAPERSPISATGRVTDTLLLFGYDLSAVGTQLGGNYAGLAKVYQGPLYTTPEDIASWSQFMANYSVDTFRASGYRLRQASTTFGKLESYSGVRFALAGKVSGVGANYYGMFAGNKTEASLTVTWELFDVDSRRVVFSTAPPEHRPQLAEALTLSGWPSEELYLSSWLMSDS